MASVVDSTEAFADRVGSGTGQPSRDTDLQPCVVVLTVDEHLASAMKVAVRDRYRLEIVRTRRATVQLLSSGHQGVLVTDSSAVDDPSRFIARVRRRYPTVVNVLVVSQSATPEFFRRLGDEAAYRLLLKPLQGGEVERTLDAAVRKFLEESPAAPLPGPDNQRRLSYPRAALAAGFLLGIGLLLFAIFSGPDEEVSDGARAAADEPTTGAASQASGAVPPEAADRIAGLRAGADAAGLLLILRETESPVDRQRTLDALLALAQEAILAGRSDSAAEIWRGLTEVAPDASATAILATSLERSGNAQAGARARQSPSLDRRQDDRSDSAGQRRLQGVLRRINALLAESRPFDPGKQDPLPLLREAERIDARSADVIEMRQRLGDRLVADTRLAMMAGDFSAADRAVPKLAALAMDAAADMIRLEQRRLRRRAAETEIRPIEAVRVLEYVAPEYPRRALRRAAPGWLDLILSVNTAGDVDGIRVEDMENGEAILDAALAAVSQWRLEPRLWEGEPIPQRVRVRIRSDSR